MCESDSRYKPSVWLTLGVLDISALLHHIVALQMFWLFLALLCFGLPLVCLELEDYTLVRCGILKEELEVDHG